MFSDRGALTRVLATLALCAALGGYYAWWAMQAQSGWRWAMADPAARDGATMVFPLWTVTRVVSDDRYEISKVVKDVPILGDARDLKAGDTVSVLGRFDAALPAVRAEVRELHVLRKYKEALGILGFVLVVIAAPFAFRFDRGRLVERG